MAFKSFFSVTKLAIYLLIFKFFFINVVSNAQIPSTTSNQYHSLSYNSSCIPSFLTPTATDAITYNYLGSIIDLQVIVATTPTPTFFWDNNGTTASINLLTYYAFPANAAVYLDDVELLNNNNSDIWAYVTCRVLLSNNTTEVHVLCLQWFYSTFTFVQNLGFATLQDIIPTTTNGLDAVMIDSYDNSNGDIVFVWNNGGNIYGTYGTINFITGQISYATTGSGSIFKNEYLLSGICPDVSMLFDTNGAPSLYVAAIENNNIKISKDGNTAQTVYSSTKTLRSVKIDAFGIGINSECIFTYEELDNLNLKSKIFLGKYSNCTTTIIQLNNELEASCTNNINYKYTGFPVVKISFYSTAAWPDFAVEVAWQQVICNGSQNCGIQAISKRISGMSNCSSFYTPSNYYFLSDDLSKNSFFPSLVSRYLPNLYNCQGYWGCIRNFYSFDVTNLNTFTNGFVVNKNSAFNGSAIRLLNPKTKTNELVKSTTFADNHKSVLNDTKLLKVFPNPAKNVLYINSNKLIINVAFFNINGVMVKNVKLNGSYQININTQSLANGSYYLKVIYMDKTESIEKIFINQ